MTSAPPIILTKLDLQRLERLLDSLDDYGPAAEALEQELSRAQVVERSEMPAGVGQHIDWPAPGGKMIKLTLLAIEYQPEAAGDPF